MSTVPSTSGTHSGVPVLHYRAPRWLPGGHAQTIWPALFSRAHGGSTPRYERQRLLAPDGDFVDVDWLRTSQKNRSESGRRPLLVLFHGLEGGSGSHYALAFADYAARLGWDFAVPHFRGCSGEMNRAPRAYHSGDHAEVAWVIDALTAERQGPCYVVGVSLGGNALLRWTQEHAPTGMGTVKAVAAISAPLDLAASGAHIDRGFNRQVYVRNFLRTMQPRALAKHRQYPNLFDIDAVMRARTLREFDNAFTAPLHGFRDTEDYWHRASSIHALNRIRIPTLIINARNDPFVPAHSLPTASQVSASVCLFQPHHGGHVGFAAGPIPGHVGRLPELVGQWLQHRSAPGVPHG
ncbi:alpha/beta fold hydrolase [Curvibacter sp. APW13]|uniref:YheT family hydrolase n=1 Tax=Curvibacter sp. APW13 TaxID=3077236 RepID=UPI0028DD9AAA|nr:alpha/beta fold hydrolase [Curvibacter sp. APW13]MDT8990678.1 alpha/beta fold hydrolase [Curvibacter sp. APW13]